MIRNFFKNRPIHKGHSYKIFKTNTEEFSKKFILSNKFLYKNANVKALNNHDDFINKVLVFEQKINWYNNSQKSKLFIIEGEEELLNALQLFNLTGKNIYFIIKIKKLEYAYDNKFKEKIEDYDLDYIDKNSFNF